ncbi:MAG: hypothetical protein ACPGLV_15950, partial [Bacteroidia bacterium]
IANDELWFSILKGIQTKYAYQTINSTDIIQYINQRTGSNFTGYFNLYINNKDVPKLEFIYDKKSYKKRVLVYYKFSEKITEFKLPVRCRYNGNEKWLYPSDQWKKLTLTRDEFESFEFDELNFMIDFNENSPPNN